MVYSVLRIDIEGSKDILGLWIAKTETAKYWLSVLTDIKNHGVKDILVIKTASCIICCTMKIPNWNRILAQFSIHLGERVNIYKQGGLETYTKHLTIPDNPKLILLYTGMLVYENLFVGF